MDYNVLQHPMMTVNITQCIVNACNAEKCTGCGSVRCGLMNVSNPKRVCTPCTSREVSDADRIQEWVMLVCGGNLPIDFLIKCVGIEHMPYLHEIVYVSMKFTTPDPRNGLGNSMQILSQLIRIADTIPPQMYPKICRVSENFNGFIYAVMTAHMNRMFPTKGYS